MEYICEVKCAEVIDEWAKRENKTVDDLLLSRFPLLFSLPLDIKWFKAKISREDLNSLRLINDLSWNDLSLFTGDLEIAARNVNIFSKISYKLPHQVLPSGITRQEYFDRLVLSLQNFRNSAGNAEHNLTLILISPTKSAPHTILEGNHTAMGLYFRYLVDHPELSYPVHHAYIGISREIMRNQWYQIG